MELLLHICRRERKNGLWRDNYAPATTLLRVCMCVCYFSSNGYIFSNIHTIHTINAVWSMASFAFKTDTPMQGGKMVTFDYFIYLFGGKKAKFESQCEKVKTVRWCLIQLSNIWTELEIFVLGWVGDGLRDCDVVIHLCREGERLAERGDLWMM